MRDKEGRQRVGGRERDLERLLGREKEEIRFTLPLYRIDELYE